MICKLALQSHPSVSLRPYPMPQPSCPQKTDWAVSFSPPPQRNRFCMFTPFRRSVPSFLPYLPGLILSCLSEPATPYDGSPRKDDLSRCRPQRNLVCCGYTFWSGLPLGTCIRVPLQVICRALSRNNHPPFPLGRPNICHRE